MPPSAILDVDGTLVDTNYQHALAWYLSFRQHDIVLPVWRIHRHIGMGGDQMVTALTDEQVEEEKGDDIRAAESPLYLAMIEQVELLADARRLMEALAERDHKLILASSAKQNELHHYLDLLDARELADDWTSSADVQETKPEPDLIKAAMEKAGEGPAVMIGDSVWDFEAAKRADVPSIGVLTGGFSEQELREAGASVVFETLAELIDKLDETPLSD